jgi:UDP-N-acetylmuramoyl-L-alanyl-D-glutamate--2,6-diaminopimelate ligase
MQAGRITLQAIVEAVQPERLINPRPAEVRAVACHPGQVDGPGCLFACIDEFLLYNRWQTWRTHLEALPALELAAVMVPEPVEGWDIPQLVCRDPRRALGLAARLVAGRPDERLQLLGVTGTNGKTTTTRLLAHLLHHAGRPCGSIGTLGIELAGPGGFASPGTYTTPLAPDLYRSLARMRQAGAAAAAMEVSSHALALERVAGLAFDGAILTNIERDHLDFHGTVAAYAEAKQRLFSRVKPDGWCVLNRHSPHCDAFAASASGRVRTYGFDDAPADVQADNLDLRPDGSAFTVHVAGQSQRFHCRLAGAFQVENALAAITLAQALGHPLEALAAAMADFPPVCGRMEQILLPNGCTAIVDYAHNPDGLAHLLGACRRFCAGRLHVVFGCGGDRDKGKRPIMGAIAARLADVCWVTSDNPRTEDPDAIIDDVLAGMDATAVGLQRVPDRAAAIRAAYAATAPGDILVVAGKGHEDYQIVGLEKLPFSDQEILRGL